MKQEADAGYWRLSPASVLVQADGCRSWRPGSLKECEGRSGTGWIKGLYQDCWTNGMHQYSGQKNTKKIMPIITGYTRADVWLAQRYWMTGSEVLNDKLRGTEWRAQRHWMTGSEVLNERTWLSGKTAGSEHLIYIYRGRRECHRCFSGIRKQFRVSQQIRKTSYFCYQHQKIIIIFGETGRFL